MANGSSKKWWSASRSGQRLGISCALVAVTVMSLGAQTSPEPNVTLLHSGLHSFLPRHFVVVTVVETGSKASSSEVRIELRDAADQRRAFAKGVLMRGQPVRLRFQVQGSGVQQLSTNLRISQLTSGGGGQPIVTLEDLDVDSLKIETKPPCAPPPFGGGGAQGNCDGWGVNRLTLDDPGPAGSVDID